MQAIITKNASSFGSPMVARVYAADTNSKYRFSFNGQEKDDEVYGEGNTTSAEFWEYDGRLGRRFNIDPKSNPSISVYACFENCPIWKTDKYGDTITFTSSFSKSKVLMSAYWLFTKTKAGKEFKRNFGHEGKYEHIKVIFDNPKSSFSYAELLKVTKDGLNAERFKEDQVIPDAEKLTNGTDKNYRVIIKVNIGNTISKKVTMFDIDEIIHETQHGSIMFLDLRNRHNIRNSKKQHILMKKTNERYYLERKEAYYQYRDLWQEDYLKSKSKGEVKDEIEYINRKTNDFFE